MAMNLLEANGIAVILVGDSVLPNLPFEVKVAHRDAELARGLIAGDPVFGRRKQS